MMENVLEFFVDLLQRWQNRESLKLGGAIRSKYWPRYRRKHLDLFPVCAVCGGSEKIEVHHIQSFHEHPELELDESNLLTLCESGRNGVICHRFFGHYGDYKTNNPNVRVDSVEWNKRILQRNK